MNAISLWTFLIVLFAATVIVYPWVILVLQFFNKSGLKHAPSVVTHDQGDEVHTKKMSMEVKNNVRLDEQMITYLIKRNVGIDISKSKNFITFRRRSSVFEIKKIEAVGEDIFYTLERSQDGKCFVMHEDVVREFMTGVTIKGNIPKYAQE